MKERPRTIVLLIIIAFSITLLLVPTIHAATLGNLHGTVVDEEGIPIEDVKVSAYLNTGSLEEVKHTNSNGYFRMSLGGTYTLVFEKEGYVTFQKNVQVTQAPSENPDNDIVKLGDLEMQKTLYLSASVVKRLTTPGNKLRLEFTITNHGDTTEDVKFSTEAPAGWDTKVLDNVGEIESILLSSGSEKYYIEITVPETATTVETVFLIATGSSTDKLGFTITPKVYTDEIKLRSTYLSVSEELGQSISLPLSVSNLGDIDKSVTLRADVPEGWSISFKTSTNMVVKTLLMEAGDTEQLTIAIEAPDTASVGDYQVTITAQDVNGAVLDNLELGINLRIGSSEIEIISSYTDITVQAGESITFPIAVWNKGEADALTLFTVPVLPENWDTSFTSDDLEISSIRIPAGESESIKLVVKPPNSVQSGTYQMTVLVESDDGSQNQLDFTIEVAGSYELGLDLSTLYTSGKIGGSVSYTGRVTNEGQTAITTLYMEADVPSDWEAIITPTQVDTLNPRSSTTFIITINIPSDAEAGDYLVTMQAMSDQLDSSSSDVRITAQASNAWGYIGIGVALVAIAGAALLFTKFKRR